MSEESVKEVVKPTKRVVRSSPSIASRALVFFSSVRFGVVLLCILVALSFLGMIIIQQNVVGFDAYYASRTPAEKAVYGALGFFDIYHSWYFNFLLLILSLNILLASIDRFPTAWKYIKTPKVWATRDFLLRQDVSEEVRLKADSSQTASAYIENVFSNSGLRTKITEHNGNLNIFGQRGQWNRIGAYIVHVALLTLFLGHFVALQTGFDADVNMVPGTSTNQIDLLRFNLDKKERYPVELPFTIYCLEVEQKLIDPKGSIEVSNTLDWRTRIRIDDPSYGSTTADVSLNHPMNYRGYRFFQAQTVPVGNARNMIFELSPTDGSKPFTIDIKRNGSTELPDGTKIVQTTFLPDFTFNAQGKPDTKSKNYNNPVAVLSVTPKDGETQQVFAFAADVENLPVGGPKAGYKWKLKSFEKAPLAHVLSIKYDPFHGAFIAWYFGGIGLIFALIFVFFISHKRIWALVQKEADSNEYLITLGGNANRNQTAFKDKFDTIINTLRSKKQVDLEE